MESLSMLLIAGMVACAGGLVLGCLFVLAVRVRDECELHDLVRKAKRLRAKQARKIAMLDDLEGVDYDGGADVEVLRDAA